MDLKVSIIIVTYNSINHIEECIKSILKQNFAYEILIVDNNSKDGTVEFIKKNFPFITIIENKKNIGMGSGNNLGVKYAAGDFIVILNDDTIVESNWLRNLIRPLKNTSKIITTPKILLYDGLKINTSGNINHFTGLGFVRGLGKKRNAYSKYEYVSGLSGCCFALRKQDYLELNGFDEKLFMYAEDTELSWRALLKNFKILYVPTSLVRHDYELKVTVKKLYYLERGRYFILKKYLSLYNLIILLPSFIITEFLVFGYAMKFGWSGIKHKIKAIQDGLTINVDKIDGNKKNLFKFLSMKIPIEQLSFYEIERIVKKIANKMYELNYQVCLIK
ncbi:MAG: glycosyltransferase family 2 protein [Candidatus Hodarchaeota archaeon]